LKKLLLKICLRGKRLLVRVVILFDPKKCKERQMDLNLLQ
jgi:hypothetical protein